MRDQNDFFFFRVNRRPLGADTLFPSALPSDMLDHVRRVLAPGWPVITGRRNQRVWMMGGIETDEQHRALTGKLGWVPKEEELITDYSEEEQDWVDSVERPHGRAVLPFALDADSRVLMVLAEGSAKPDVISTVFEQTLQGNEDELSERTTEWAVEPIFDPTDFESWLKKVDIVRSVTFTARLPNPEPKEAFENIAERMKRRNATRFSEKMYSNRDGGLTGIQRDQDFAEAQEMAQDGFATLDGEGELDGRRSLYHQKQRVARGSIDELPEDWEELRKVLVEFLKERAQKLLNR